MPSLYETSVLISDTICLSLFGYIIYVFLKIYMKLQDKSLLYLSCSFTLLAFSQLSSIFSVLIESSRLSLTLYILTSSLAATSFLLIVVSVLQEKRALTVVAPIIVAVPDLIACALAAVASFICEGKQLKAYLLALSIVHVLRGLGSALIYVDVGMLLPIASEIARAFATLLFAIFHVSRVVGRE
ncbi:MAG: hypothetical protein QW701_01080 [Candidatus Nezhaarchaeales archaeon]